MDIIKFTVYKQHLILKTDLRKRVATSDTINQFKCQFTFDENWNGFEKRVYFKNLNYNTIKTTLLDASGYCYIPWEVIAHTGQIVCTVTGSKYSNGSLAARLTTNSIKFFLKNTGEGLYESIMTADPSPSEFEQFVAQVYNDSQIANSAKVAALEAQVKAELAESRIKGMTASATGLAENQNPTVTLTDFSDHFNLEFGIPAGHSPAITASKAAGVTTVKVDGSTVASIEDGTDGQDGEDGYAPIATVSKSGDTTTISITDKNGTTTADVYDGSNVQSDWNEADSTADDYIKNKPTIPADKVFIAEYGVTSYSDLVDAIDANKVIVVLESATEYEVVTSCQYDSSKVMLSWEVSKYSIFVSVSSSDTWSSSSTLLQSQLISGTNIKTINNESLLGSGDITVAASGTSTPTADTASEFDSSAHMNSTDMSVQDVSDFIDDLDLSGSNILGSVYPVGSYYVTYDSLFNPNSAFDGTWVLEASNYSRIRKLLWHNPTPTNAFASQAISIPNLRSYDHIEVSFFDHTSYLDFLSPVTVDVDVYDASDNYGFVSVVLGSIGAHSGAAWLANREFSVWYEDKEVLFGDAYSITVSGTNTFVKNNAACIPRDIFGLTGKIAYHWRRTA